MTKARSEQSHEDIFALDIGTRSIIGIVGRMEGERFRVLALEKENHDQRAMLDGQIEDIDRVAEVAAAVRKRLEARLQMRLNRVCVAAAGRALQSERGTFSLEFEDVQMISEEMVNQLEAGAASDAERTLIAEQDQKFERFFMVGYTVVRYATDGYTLSSLREHKGRLFEAEVMATFLPQEVVESLYAVVGKLGLEVASLTLEPIASLNAAIPADIRLLNLALVDIGAGTSDIAVCRDGSVVGYTMATMAGDEVTEQLMRKYLIDFQTGERIKTEMSRGGVSRFEDILGMEHEVSAEELWEIVEPESRALAMEIAGRIMELNGKPPAAAFLAGGGSKLKGLAKQVAAELKLEETRVVIAGRHFARSAFSEDYQLDDPEYSTPLGIAISAAMGLINDSYVVLLNGKPAKLFRSGTLTVRDILLMNGYHYADLIGRSGANLNVKVNGERRFIKGRPAVPPVMTVNGELAELSTVVRAGDAIAFEPAKAGRDASRVLKDILGEDYMGPILVNGIPAKLEQMAASGDEIWAEGLLEPEDEYKDELEDDLDGGPEAVPESPAGQAVSAPQAEAAEPKPAPVVKRGESVSVTINGNPMILKGKDDGEPYYLMDLLQYSGLDLEHLRGPVDMFVNGFMGQFTQRILSGDNVVIRYRDE